MNTKRTLKKEVWENVDYYKIIENTAVSLSHPGMKELTRLAGKSKNILDLGCGEGSRLLFVTQGKVKGTGIDISKVAIKRAKKRYPELNFLEGDLESLPFGDESFDLVYSSYVFEHLDKPEKVIGQAIRVLKQYGYFVVISPNYGSPNRVSPPFRKNRMIKFLSYFIQDIFRVINNQEKLKWNKVVPIAKQGKYKMDWDTVVEPYIGSLVKYLTYLNFRIISWDVCWEEELNKSKIFQKVVRILGKMGLYPFKYWGPQLVVVAQKM